MQRHQQGLIEWITYDLLSEIPQLTHATFLRHGGVSEEPYDSLNVAFHVGDDPDAVHSNIHSIKQTLHLNEVFYSYQIHGTNTLFVTEHTNSSTESFDALMTQLPHKPLMIKHADCQAALFYDPIHHAIANVHCGWRGNVQNIYKHTIHTMQKQFETKPEELLVCISPSLGPQAAQFINYREELPKNFWDYQVKPHYFDFWAISEMQLRSCGVLPHHIEIARICTYSNPKDFFSYRRRPNKNRSDGYGAHATLISLN